MIFFGKIGCQFRELCCENVPTIGSYETHRSRSGAFDGSQRRSMAQLSLGISWIDEEFCWVGTNTSKKAGL